MTSHRVYGFRRSRLTFRERELSKQYWDFIHDMAPKNTTTDRAADAATANAPTTLPSNPDTEEQRLQAEKILESGRVRLGSTNVRVFKPDEIEELPRVKTEELLGREIIILEVPGTITSQEYGTAHRVTLAFAENPRERLSWLCDVETVMGRQLTDQVKKGLPLWISVQERTAKSGRSYYTFDTPERLLRATGRYQSEYSQGELEDLPF